MCRPHIQGFDIGFLRILRKLFIFQSLQVSAKKALCEASFTLYWERSQAGGASFIDSVIHRLMWYLRGCPPRAGPCECRDETRPASVGRSWWAQACEVPTSPGSMREARSAQGTLGAQRTQ